MSRRESPLSSNAIQSVRQWVSVASSAHTQATAGYSYDGPSALAGKHFSDFNREQQGEIAADYYNDVLYGSVPASNCLPLIEELQAGKL